MEVKKNITQPRRYPSAVGIHNSEVGGVVDNASRDFPDAFDNSFIQKNISVNDVCPIVPSGEN